MSANMLLADEIMNTIWAITPRQMNTYLPIATQILKGEGSSYSELKAIKEQVIEANKPRYSILANNNTHEIYDLEDISDAPKGSVAILSYSGVVRQDGGMSHKGTTETRKEFRAAGLNPNIKAVMFKVNSGGGSVFGTEAFSNEIRDFKKTYGKSVGVLIQGQAGSAMYWMISGADYIYAESNSCETGCIGTMSSFVDYSEYFEKNGVKNITVRASKSFQKNEPYYQALQGNLKPLQEQVLDPLNNAFLSSVKRNRKGKIDLTDKVTDDVTNKSVARVLSGITTYGIESVKNGLIDAIGSEQDLLKVLNKESKNFINNKKSTMEIKNYTALNDVALNFEISNLTTSMPIVGAEGFEAQNTLLALATAEKSKRTAEARVSELEKLQSNTDTTELKSTIERLENEATSKDEIIEANATKISDLETTAGLANEDLEAKDATILELNATIEASTKKTTALEAFIESNFEAGTVGKFVANDSGEISQPEGVKPKVVYKSRLEKKAENKNKVSNMLSKLDK